MLRDRLKQRLFRREKEAMDDMITLYQESIQSLQLQLQNAEHTHQDLQDALRELQHQHIELEAELEGLRAENKQYCEEFTQFRGMIPVGVHLPRSLCKEQGCSQQAYRGGFCFEHYRMRALQGGPLL